MASSGGSGRRAQLRTSNLKAFIGAVLDITEEKRTEQTLRDKEARLEAAVDLVGLSVYSWDLFTGTADWDDRIKASWGLPPEAKVDLALALSAVHPDDLPGFEAIIARAADSQGDGIYRAEYRVVGIEDRSNAGYPATARPPLWTGRHAVRWAVREITEEKRTEQRLRESEARLQAAVDLAKLGLYAWNPQTDELQWDDTLRAMWGLPAGAPVDCDVWRVRVHPDDLVRVEAALQRCTDPRAMGVRYRVPGDWKNGRPGTLDRNARRTNSRTECRFRLWGRAGRHRSETYRKCARAPR